MAQYALLPYFWRSLEILRPVQPLLAWWSPFYGLLCSSSPTCSSPTQRPMASLCSFSSPKPRGPSFQCHLCAHLESHGRLLSWSPYKRSKDSCHWPFLTTFMLYSLVLKSCCSFPSIPWMVVVKIKICFRFRMEGWKQAYIPTVLTHSFPLDCISGNPVGGEKQLPSHLPPVGAAFILSSLCPVRTIICPVTWKSERCPWCFPLPLL